MNVIYAIEPVLLKINRVMFNMTIRDAGAYLNENWIMNKDKGTFM